jgi:hypothetical protein
MNAVRLLEIAWAAGLSLEVEGNNLVVEADGDLPTELIAELRQHKAELIAALLPDARNASPNPHRMVRDAHDLPARAAIIEDVSAHPRRDAEANLIAPLPWHQRAVSSAAREPPHDQPCPSRCGRIERTGAIFLHFCVTCGAWGAYGYGVTRDRPGLWYCGKHRSSEKPP